MDNKHTAEIRRAVSNALDHIAPDPLPILENRPDLQNPDKTTVWLRSVTRKQLEAWCRLHNVTAKSLQRALEEYDIGRRNTTPKRFDIIATSQGYYVQVIGHRRHPRTQRARAQAEEHSPTP